MQLGKRRRTLHLYGEGPQAAADARANGPTVRVVHECPPIVVYADPSDFRQIVQQLTGKFSVANTDTINERSKSLAYVEASSALTTLESRSCKEVDISQISEHSVMCDSGRLICKAVSVGQSMCYSGHRLPLLDYSKHYITNTAHGCINPHNHGRLKQLKANISSTITTKEEEEIETPTNLNLCTPLISASETDQRQRIINTNWSDDASPALTASAPHQCFLHFDAFPFADCLEVEGFDSQLDYLLLL